MDLFGFDVTIARVVAGIGILLGWWLNLSARRLSKFQYEGSPPISMILGWTTQNGMAGDRLKMAIKIKFWNHRKYALEVFHIRLAVPSVKFWQFHPTDMRMHGFNTTLGLEESVVVEPGESASFELITPYKLMPDGIFPYPFMVILTYLDPRTARYRELWLHSLHPRKPWWRLQRDRIAEKMYYPVLTWRLRLASTFRLRR